MIRAHGGGVWSTEEITLLGLKQADLFIQIKLGSAKILNKFTCKDILTFSDLQFDKNLLFHVSFIKTLYVPHQYYIRINPLSGTILFSTVERERHCWHIHTFTTEMESIISHHYIIKCLHSCTFMVTYIKSYV